MHLAFKKLKQEWSELSTMSIVFSVMLSVTMFSTYDATPSSPMPHPLLQCHTLFSNATPLEVVCGWYSGVLHTGAPPPGPILYPGPGAGGGAHSSGGHDIHGETEG